MSVEELVIHSELLPFVRELWNLARVPDDHRGIDQFYQSVHQRQPKCLPRAAQGLASGKHANLFGPGSGNGVDAWWTDGRVAKRRDLGYPPGPKATPQFHWIAILSMASLALKKKMFEFSSSNRKTPDSPLSVVKSRLTSIHVPSALGK